MDIGELPLEERIETFLDPSAWGDSFNEEQMVTIVNTAMDLLTEALEELRKGKPKDSG